MSYCATSPVLEAMLIARRILCGPKWSRVLPCKQLKNIIVSVSEASGGLTASFPSLTYRHHNAILSGWLQGSSSTDTTHALQKLHRGWLAACRSQRPC